MSYIFLYFNEVQADIAEAKHWYAEQQKGLEKRFANDIKNCLEKIKQFPHANRIRYKNIRIAHPKVFPDSIHYFINDKQNQIVITAIAHNSRNPNFARRGK